MKLLSKLMLILALLSLLVACKAKEEKNEPKTIPASASVSKDGKTRAKVTRVVDGDTLKVEVNGKEETVRMLLVDTPETVHPSKPVEPFGKDASDFAKKELTGKTVELEKAVSDTDRYDRLLRFVYVDGKMFNETLVEKGLARVAEYNKKDSKYIDEFRELESKAKKGKIGIWSIKGYVTDNGYNDAVAN